jgi:chromatin remodeling complex protein RSC6
VKETATPKKVTKKEDAPVAEPAPAVAEAEEAVVEETASQSLSDELAQVSATLKKVSTMVQLLAKEVTDLKKKAQKLEAEKAKADKKKSNRRTGNSNGLKQENAVIRKEFADFVKANTALKGKDGNIIVESIKYDANGNLLLNRAAALRLVTSYIKAHGLQKFPEDKKCIEMDDSLQKVLVETGETKKMGNKNVRVCFYKDIMGGLNKNFASNKK